MEVIVGIENDQDLDSIAHLDFAIGASVALDEILPVIRTTDVLGGRGHDRFGVFLRAYLGVDPRHGPGGWRKIFDGVVGEVPYESHDKYEIFSAEKAIRLMVCHSMSNHYTSWESREPGMWKFGGAVIVNVELFGRRKKILVSVSGLPEEADETLAILTLCRMGLIDERYHRHHLTQVSGNPFTLLILGH